MEIIGGYRYYSREEHVAWCKANDVPQLSDIDEPYRNRRTESGRPFLTQERKTTMTKERLEFKFKQFCRRNNIKEVDGDVVDDYMFLNDLFGEAIYNFLMTIKL